MASSKHFYLFSNPDRFSLSLYFSLFVSLSCYHEKLFPRKHRSQFISRLKLSHDSMETTLDSVANSIICWTPMRREWQEKRRTGGKNVEKHARKSLKMGKFTKHKKPEHIQGMKLNIFKKKKSCFLPCHCQTSLFSMTSSW